MIFDKFKGQGTEDIQKLLEDNHVNVVMVPANCTDRLQPLDISVNKAAKNLLRGQFQDWYASQICQQIQGDTGVQAVDLRLSIIKPLGAKWMLYLYDYLKSKPDIIRNGFSVLAFRTFCLHKTYPTKLCMNTQSLLFVNLYCI